MNYTYIVQYKQYYIQQSYIHVKFLVMTDVFLAIQENILVLGEMH